MDRKPLVIGNWKMHGSFEFNKRLIEGLRAGMKGVDDVECVVCPPAVYLSQVNELLKKSSLLKLSQNPIHLGAQNVCAEESGAFTGEVSISMLTEIGCRYVIIGHMERRTLYGEDDSLIGRKFKAAEGTGLMPVLCVGDTLEQRNKGIERDVIRTQLRVCLDEEVKHAFAVAYEPGWAIGAGCVAEPGQIEEMHGFIAECIEDCLKNEDLAPRVIYGGSVKADNAADLFALKRMDGVLVGGASLDAEDFSQIARLAQAKVPD